MRRVAWFALATVSSSLPVMAADLPTRASPPPEAIPVFTWTSVYFGASAGYGSLSGTPTTGQCRNPQGVLNGFGCPGTPFLPGPIFIANTASPPKAPGLPNRADSAVAGGRVGFDTQLAGTDIVLGAEAAASYTGLDSMSTRNGIALVSLPDGGVRISRYTLAVRDQLDYLATLRGRVGYAFDRLLIFGTGGLAFGQTTLGATSSTNFVTYDATKSRTQVGWTAGGGLEYAIPNSGLLHLSPQDGVTVTVAADYYDLGHRTVLGPEASARTRYLLGARFGTEGVLARAGLNYRFAAF